MSTPDVETIRAAVAALVERDPAQVGDDADLIELGLDSISLMRLVSGWRRDGATVTFADLAAVPTVAGWAAVLGGAAPAPAPEPVAHDRTDEPPGFGLARLQHAYWVGRADNQPLGGVAAHLYVEFDRAAPGVAPDRLRAALTALVARHEMLRVRFTDDGEQEVLPARPYDLTVHDLAGLAPDAVAAALETTRDTCSHQLLDVASGEVFSAALSLLPGGGTRLHLDVDMLAGDAMSYRILLADLARLHDDPAALLPPLRYRYRDYLADRAGHRVADRAAAAAWWEARLPDLPGAPELPAAPAGPRPARVVRRNVWFDPAQRAALTAAARRRGVTTAMAVATAFAEVVGAWCGPRFLLNVPTFDREPLHPDVEHLVGDFTSSALLEVDLTERLPFADRAHAVQARMHADAGHVEHSGVDVLRDLARHRGHQVLAPVVFTSALSLGELYDAPTRAAFGDPVWTISQGPQVLLDAQVTEIDGGLLMNWDLRESELADGVPDALFGAFESLVRRLANDDGAWDEPVDGLVAPERLAVREAEQAPGTRSGRRLHDGVFAAADPDAPAVLATSGVLTHGELTARALAVAGALVAAGVRPGDAVVVTLPKGPDQVVAVLGVLAARGTYVPVGVDQPPLRAARITERAQAAVTITPAFLTAAATHAPLDAPLPGPDTDRAYLLFTSGSTGEPKGVDVPHRAAMATIDDLVERFGIGPADRTLGVSALDFDLSVFDLFAPLSVGGAVVVVEEAERRDAQQWARLVAEHGVTVLNCVPQLLDMILASGEPVGDALRLVLLGGDRVGVDLPARLAAAVPGCRFVGLGGTTETAIHSTVCEVTGPVPARWTCVPYGAPLRGVALRVVDPHGRDAPDHVPGELWIGGDGVAQGYHGDPDRTADRFVVHDGRRWYRTGDRARYDGDGCVEFLGRADHQVKVRGFRIELGEIEAALSAADGVREAVAVTVDGALAAAVTGDRIDGETVRAHLLTGLPQQMVPDRVHVLDALPLTANGKLDRAAVTALLEHSGPGADTGRVPLRTPLERVIGAVWTEVLTEARVLRGEVGATDELFVLGGDSVLATTIVARLREELETSVVSVRMLFGAPTVGALAAAVAAAEPDPARLAEAAALFLEIEDLSDDEVDAGLAQVRR